MNKNRRWKTNSNWSVPIYPYKQFFCRLLLKKDMADQEITTDTAEARPKTTFSRGRGGKSRVRARPASDLSRETKPIQPNKPVKSMERNTERQDKIVTKEESLFKEAIFSGERVLKPCS